MTTQRYTVLRYRGIGEMINQPTMLDAVAGTLRALDPTKYDIVDVPWRAEYGPVPFPMGASFDRSLADGLPMALEYIHKTPNRVVQLGYSGGAALAGNVAAEVTARYRDLEIAVTGLISDPFRDPGNTHIIGAAHGWGVAGRRVIQAPWSGAGAVIQVADPRDVICCCPENSPIRTIADQTTSLSLSDPIAWGRTMVRKLMFKQFQGVVIPWHDTAEVRRIYGQAIADVNGYLGGDHTSYAIRDAGPGRSGTYAVELGRGIHHELLRQEREGW